MEKNNDLEVATLAGGCFWCTEAIFQRLKGVVSVTSGYTGGNIENPTYQQVSSGKTGHTEAIHIKFDPSIISFDKLLEVFWVTHDPTTINRQGGDVGTQYRSAIFYHNENQKLLAEKSLKDLEISGKYSQPIVTKIEPFTHFYSAEDYHQNYYEKYKTSNPYCNLVIEPKLKKLFFQFNNIVKKNI